MSTRHHLLNLLSDGAFHSGTVLGERLGISRAAVNKAVQALVGSGIDIHRISGRGYRLGEAFVPLSETTIRAWLSAQGITSRVDVLDEVDSTSQYLLRALGPGDSNGRVCLGESQSAGRGRRGRGWVATPYQNLALSIAWRFEFGPAAIAGLSLAAGVAVLRALEEFGVRDAGLKWPNDILLDGRKLAGLLVDVRGEVAGPSLVVLGLGLNVHLAARDAALIDQPWAMLVERVSAPVDRNRLAALIIAHLLEMFRAFERTGFESFHAEWERLHVFAGKAVRLLTSQEEVTGTVEGIDPRGGLQLRDASGRVQTFYSGEVSLRAGGG
jgi:BirA family biotin operon repressor/biotin-[acetyl-CoA-carboxylase] ligase